ncbi:MAG: SRPBCC family protein [Myxococcota bacterium]
MKQEKAIELISECLELIGKDEPFMTNDEMKVPVREYLDERMFDEERAQLLRSSMNIVAHGSQVSKPGDFITRDVLGTPVLLARQKDGTLKAFVNVCRHRGATVETRSHGNCRRFVCPYHAWTYRTDGALAAVRHEDGFPTLDVANTHLVELQCYEAAGLVWVCPDPQAPTWSPDEGTRTLIAELEGLGCGSSVVFASDDRVWHANWKLIADGGLESYHFKILHRNTIADFFTDNISTFEFLGDHIRTVLPQRSIVELREQPESTWDIRKHTHVVYFVAPNATILIQEGHYELILTTPLSVGQTRIEVLTVVPAPRESGFSDRATQFWTANHDFTRKTLYEDFEVGEQIQRGMHTGANEFFRFARFEGALTQWHERLANRLGR